MQRLVDRPARRAEPLREHVDRHLVQRDALEDEALSLGEVLLDGAVDVGFASRPVVAPSLHVTPLFEDRLWLVTSAGHPLATAPSADAAEIARERFILFERGASIRAATDAFFDKARVVPSTVLESNDTFIDWRAEAGTRETR